MSRVLDLHRKSTTLPLVGPLVGERLFSFAFSQVAPYFWSIRPRFTVIEPNHAEVVIPKRRAVKNHIGTVHAIALCNGLEAAMGLVAEATCPDHQRWLPRGLNVEYLAKSTTDLLCVAETSPQDWDKPAPFDLEVRVKAVRTDGVVAVQGTIPVYVSEKPAKTAP